MAEEPLSDQEKRRAYQRQYYLAHQDKAKAYQRNYNLNHKKRKGPKRGSFLRRREAARLTFNAVDLMALPAEKFYRAVNQITTGQRLFTM